MKVPKDFKPEPGDKFYSKFFDSKATVVRFTSPGDWTFTLDNGTRVLKANSKPWELDWIYINAIHQDYISGIRSEKED